MKKKRVAVTGLGVIALNGCNVKDFWTATCNGRSGVRPITTFDTSPFKAKVAGIVEYFDEEDCEVSAASQAGYDRYVLFALAAASEAVNMAKLDFDKLDPHRIGVCVATAIGATKYLEEEFLHLTDGGHGDVDAEKASPVLLSGLGFHVASTEIARRYGASGPVSTLATGCTGGIDAVGEALDMIRSGNADIVIAGASDAPITPIALGAFDIIGAVTSDRNDKPESASRPYDASRSGFVLAEGAGIFILEDMEHAIARDAHIFAEISGFGSTCNAHHMTDLKPDGEDLHRAMVLSLADAGFAFAEISHVNAHGSSTPQNDINETNAIKRTFGDYAYRIPVTSIKSIVGHALAAANAIELVASIQSIVHQEVPPTLNLHQPDPACDLDYVPGKGRPAVLGHILKDASGFSGIHSALIISQITP
ncbi:hypothetical protein HMPREF9701_01901 [Delftia acidovorans CCUG 274B]|uniref:beta-ketoacyl-[acyl-carrier-protein] synthase family protein n=1 Tax=Delftia acidovorans TaxID=80866 RepID=UPI000353A96F|nr:beta-ketoacyl-[acyl-carrier-protein] synthase family protein [Delftia acidovorans]EPD41347.1 hypothetical protein HMPREF9701_01901 [Delftia acidovorans CCUG 274B]